MKRADKLEHSINRNGRGLTGNSVRRRNENIIVPKRAVLELRHMRQHIGNNITPITAFTGKDI